MSNEAAPLIHSYSVRLTPEGKRRLEKLQTDYPKLYPSESAVFRAAISFLYNHITTKRAGGREVGVWRDKKERIIS